MTEPARAEILETLACEIGSRPAGAPAIGEIIPALRSARRDDDALILAFDPTSADLVSAVVAAERVCCSTIRWDLEVGQEVRLRIGAGPAQLDVLAAIFVPPSSTR
jgi:hypothetical protein